MDLETKKIYKTKRSNPLFLSLWFLVFTIILTLGIYFYNFKLINDNIALNQEIETKESSISQLEKDSKIIISLLYNSNLSSIKKLENYSNVTLFIDHILMLNRKYNIDFESFNYSLGKLSLLAISSSDADGTINYKKVSDFISEYRKNEDKKALFDLDLVKNIATRNEWIDNIFNINLNLKGNISNIVEQLEIIRLENNEKLRIEEEKRKEEFKKKKENLLEKKEREKEAINTGSTLQDK